MKGRHLNHRKKGNIITYVKERAKGKKETKPLEMYQELERKENIEKGKKDKKKRKVGRYRPVVVRREKPKLNTFSLGRT